MSRESQTALSARVAAAAEEIAVGARYSHYKSDETTYLVREIAILEATDEPCVIYQAEYGQKVTFVRPVASWLENVAVEGRLRPRFRKIDS